MMPSYSSSGRRSIDSARCRKYVAQWHGQILGHAKPRTYGKDSRLRILCQRADQVRTSLLFRASSEAILFSRSAWYFAEKFRRRSRFVAIF
jgi:hypothetical protein